MRKNHHESYDQGKANLILRAKRIQGQVQALVRALDEERDCSDVLQLMSAARGARCPAARGQECVLAPLGNKLTDASRPP
jgi:Metal-sensitive transcriptional repressor